MGCFVRESNSSHIAHLAHKVARTRLVCRVTLTLKLALFLEINLHSEQCGQMAIAEPLAITVLICLPSILNVCGAKGIDGGTEGRRVVSGLDLAGALDGFGKP